ncbi:MAG: DMT family transporter [Acetobacteraceae bacterium]|nr:DMT family transporter [Acetobacteraceae bacterium]MBV8523190.1 DMT family transporter [Acetobacteraceae bacterium]MBV8591598.1 DMT family transporter [Acetobacteraceae bacterium]
MLVRLAPFGFVLLWSSSFVAAKAGLQRLSPLLFVSIRVAGCAAVLIMTMLLLRRSWRPLAGWNWLHCSVAGALLNAIGLMAPHVGLRLAPAAQIALVQSLTPLLTAAAGVLVVRERLWPSQWAGLVLGVIGVGLVVGQAAFQSPTQFGGLALAFLGVLGLVAGTLYFARFCRGIAMLPGAAAQFTAAALVAGLGAALLERPRADWTSLAMAAVVWNTVMVSLGGMSLYYAMLSRGTAAQTTANFYLVPGTVALLAWVLLGEELSLFAVLGLVTASAGCWLVRARPALAGAQHPAPAGQARAVSTDVEPL